MFFNEYPYTDFHELNLDMILKMMRELYHDWNEFTALNKITNAGAWDITKQYQAWTVVSDHNAGYISLKPVAAGIAISNTEYWGLIADYDILITDLTQRIIDLENAVDTINNTDIPGLQNQIDTINDTDIPNLQDQIDTINNTDIPNLQDQIDTINNTDIPALDDRLSLLDNRKFIFIADSYAATSGYVTTLNAYLGLTADVNSFCNAQGGEGFTTGTDGNGFLYELQQHAATITDRDSISDIFVLGGANDAATAQSYGVSTIHTGVEAFVLYARANFPNAKIHIGFIGKCHYNSPVIGGRNQKNQEIMCYNYRNEALLYGCAYIDDIEYTTRWLGQLTTDADGLHPDSGAGILIAQALENYILGSEPITTLIRYPLILSSTPGGTNVDCNISSYNELSILHIGEISGEFTGTFNAGNADSTSRFTIGYLDKIFVNRPIYGNTTMFVRGISPYIFNVNFKIQGSKITAVVLNSNGFAWDDLTLSSTFVVISPTDIVFDTIALG